MKKLTTLLSLALCIGVAHGQISMFVHQNNSSTVIYNIDDVRKITFDSGMNVHPNTGVVSNYVIDDVRKLTFEPGVFTSIEKPESLTSSLRAYPNPTSNNINIEYSLGAESDVNLSLYNVKGDLVRHTDIGSKTEGIHTFKLDLSNNRLSPGIYVMQLKTNNSIQTNKIIIQ